MARPTAGQRPTITLRIVAHRHDRRTWAVKASGPGAGDTQEAVLAALAELASTSTTGPRPTFYLDDKALRRFRSEWPSVPVSIAPVAGV